MNVEEWRERFDGLPDGELDAVRMVGVTRVHPDGSATSHVWTVSAADCERLAGWLGPAESTFLIPAGSAAVLASLEGELPRLPGGAPA